MLPARVGRRKKLPPPGHPGWGPKSDPLRLGMRCRGCKSTWNLCRARNLPDDSQSNSQSHYGTGVAHAARVCHTRDMNTTQAATLPRTAREIIAAVETVSVDGVAAEVRWYGDRMFDVLVPRRFRAADGTRSVKLQVMGRLGWYMQESGKFRVSGQVDDIRRALANVAEGKDAMKPRRSTVTAEFPGRDTAGRFTTER